MKRLIKIILFMMLCVVGFLLAWQMEKEERVIKERHVQMQRLQAYDQGFRDALNSCLQHLQLSNKTVELAPILADMKGPK